jgi:hypothetical protein
MHELVSQFARAGEEQQSFCVQVKAPYRLPLSLLEARQATEYRWSILRIIIGYHLANRFVICNHSGRRWINPIPNGLTVDFDLIAVLNALANVSWLVVDGDAALKNELLHFQSRPQPGLGQYLVQLGRFNLWRQNTLGNWKVSPFLIRIELPRYDIFKPDGFQGSLALSTRVPVMRSACVGAGLVCRALGAGRFHTDSG